ncbi:hypothetical protein SNE40_018378 [Patella caerulea]
MKLYEACVVPITDYGAAIWGYKSHNSLEMIENRAMRFLLGDHRFTSLLGMSGDSGSIPCTQRRRIKMFQLWNRLLSLDDDRLTKKVFENDFCCATSNKNWCADMKVLFEKLNLSDYYTNKLSININVVKSKMWTYVAESWHVKLSNSPKLRTYAVFKNEFKTENYLVFNLPRNERSILAQFRCGVLPLRVETGRFIGEKLEDRTCQMCAHNCIEDEKHFILSCSLYSDLRQYWFNEATSDLQSSQMQDNDRLIYLMNNLPRRCAKFLTRAFLRPRNKLFN